MRNVHTLQKNDCRATNNSTNTIKDKDQGVKNFTSVTHWFMQGEIEAMGDEI